jgi:hypothetical protein
MCAWSWLWSKGRKLTVELDWLTLSGGSGSHCLALGVLTQQRLLLTPCADVLHCFPLLDKYAQIERDQLPYFKLGYSYLRKLAPSRKYQPWERMYRNQQKWSTADHQVEVVKHAEREKSR